MEYSSIYNFLLIFKNFLKFILSNSVTDEVVGTHYIDLSQISNDGANGKLD